MDRPKTIANMIIGTWASTGTFSLTPSRLRPPVELEDHNHDAVGGADAEQVEDGGLDGERKAAEGGS